ncbi:biotin-dependent carboxyltransferase family protein [uncultured Psychroserpens sp.]|uniref:5-oxoprolinase subunit C family protein n=1 Tax=uncultured Psychroserpens sp. TaxID=255436 RepID=UPI002631D987|nr:biotin-dependent carboxyltransferase family protein [uncultured Psychroserpens sp.]
MVDVLKAGLFDTIQDFGRFGMQDYGVPYSGVMDTYSATLGNSILGNEKGAAVMECTINGPQLKFNTATLICITGALMQPNLNGQTVRNNKAISVKENDVLRFGKLQYGCRCYISVLGGFRTEIVLGSRSMYQGITSKFKIERGDKLPISSFHNSNTDSLVSIKVNEKHFQTLDVDVFMGPEFKQLSVAQQKLLFHQTFSISTESNRMAYQFNELFVNDLDEIITSLVLPGTVQLTPSGQLITLMRDGQTTGGYPRILQLSKDAINILAQKSLGDKIRFKCIK